MAVIVLDLIQSGSGASEIHVANGDSLTFQLAETPFSNVLQQTVDRLTTVLGPIIAVNFVANLAGGASTALSVQQSGSASVAIAAKSGDTITLELAETVFGNVLAQAVKELNYFLTSITGVNFVANPSGGAT